MTITKRSLVAALLLFIFMVLPVMSQVDPDGVEPLSTAPRIVDISAGIETVSIAERPETLVTPGTLEVPSAAKICERIFFSTEEDFVTLGPEPPDGNPIISDGDLIGPGCVVFARNWELLRAFKPEQDLGLDAVDVIDQERFIVAFSTELDEPRGIFTAGDLLTTDGAVIPNIALLANFNIQRSDLGLDSVHFVGSPERIIKFLESASEVDRDRWLGSPGMLPEMLKEHGIDIWFSTEGTSPKPEDPLFLDGDLLSARDGIIVARNALLLPNTVPAGIPDRGVDFGLDGVTASRDGNRELIHFSTEILYEGRLGFTDGDVILIRNGVICTNADLIKCFEPRADELGLDALSIFTGYKPHPCAAEIIRAGGMAAGSINSDGLANGWSATTPSFEAFDSPFGGTVEILGKMPSCEECTRFKVEYAEWSDSATPPDPEDFKPLVAGFKEWMVIPDIGIYLRVDRIPDSDGWLDILCDTVMGGLYYPWNTGGMNGKYSVRLTVEDASAVSHVSAPVVLMIDNTRPVAILNIDKVPVCGDISIGDKVSGKITATDEHFYSYRLRYESSLASGLILTPVRKYSGAGDEGDVDEPFSWDTTGLPACGYRIVLEVWDRTIVNNRRGWSEPGYAHRNVTQQYFCLGEAI